MEKQGTTYIKVLIPLKIRKSLTYSVCGDFSEKKHDFSIGEWVNVNLVGKNYNGIIEEILDGPDFDPEKIKSINGFPDIAGVSEKELRLWRFISDYYMCSMGEVMAAACPDTLQVSSRYIEKAVGKCETEGESTGTAEIRLPVLSEAQDKALEQIRMIQDEGKVAFLNGVTGSGKTEIYIHLIKEALDKGRNVLYMLPEVAVSSQLGHRLKKIFGDRLLVFHSRQSIAKRKEIISLLREGKGPYLVLGLRSSVFLPFGQLGLVIIDEEHDTSYKQDEPAPRYNGRDCAIFLAGLHGARILLGSATPSFESLYNIDNGKYSEVRLTEKYHKSIDPEISLVNMIQERKKNAVRGSFSLKLIKEIQQTLDNGEQAMIFRSRRAYSPLMQCTECGEIPGCPHCNIHLSYHKFRNRLSCHYCNYTLRLEEDAEHNLKCPHCGAYALKPLGAGTERIEEELQGLFPEARIARFDADTTMRKSDQERIIKDFACGNTDILVGTQMISKGFDFENLSLVAILQAESVLSVNDFRADEKALGLFIQLMGRAGRREKKGRLVIQTSQAEHSIFKESQNMLAERKEFCYPPYTRIIRLTLKDRNEKRLWARARNLEKILHGCAIDEYAGPAAPPVDKVMDEYSLSIMIRLKKNKSLPEIKKRLYDSVYDADPNEIIIDVDPL